MRRQLGLFIVTALIVVGSWWWRGTPVAMPPAPLPGGEKLECVSYAPFRGAQTPLDPTTVIPPSQIRDDLELLGGLTRCVRIYSVDLGLARVPELAEQFGLKVLLGIWISSEKARNAAQIEAGVALANRHPSTVIGIVVGNEVLLRGELTDAALEVLIKDVRGKVRVPVTYADVWEFWLRHARLAAAVDFVTVHILPYWEDIPIPAHLAAAHTVSIRRKVAEAFPGKDVIVGEAGWPSAGRMREGALPSRANQARVLHDLVAASRGDGFRLNVIEAFDQAWKRHLEGTVGGHWGLIADHGRIAKFAWGEPVSNRPYWPWQAAIGVGLAALVMAAEASVRRRRMQPEPAPVVSIAVAAIAVVAGMSIGAVVENAYLEALGPGGWLRSVTFVGLAAIVPITAAAALGAGVALAPMARLLGPEGSRATDVLSRLLVLLGIVTAILAAEAALGLTFNPRYLDFPFYALSSAVVPLLIVSWVAKPAEIGERPAAETALAILLVACAAKIASVETFSNWQAIWTALVLVAFAVTLARVRLAPG